MAMTPRPQLQLLIALLFLTSLSASVNAQRRVLLIGNSYTMGNDLGGKVRNLLNTLYKKRPNTVDVVASGGQTFVGHAASLRMSRSGSVGGALGKQPPYNFVVFQEQSQIPGFFQLCGGNSDCLYPRSANALKQLTDRARKARSISILFATWGRLDGDSYNRGAYPDFSTMNSLIFEGYIRYLRMLRASGNSQTRVAPCGWGFGLIYAREKKWRDGKASKPSVLLQDLYTSDGSHPSEMGTYLCALTIAGSVAARALEGPQYRLAGLSSRISDVLMKTARNARKFCLPPGTACVNSRMCCGGFCTGGANGVCALRGSRTSQVSSNATTNDWESVFIPTTVGNRKSNNGKQNMTIQGD